MKILLLNKMIFGSICVIICLLVIIYYLCYQNEFIIQSSNIHGKGLFSKKSYKKGDIIIQNLFPYKPDNRIIKHPIDVQDFNQIIMKEGLYINHCSKKYNTTLITKDYKTFQLIALKKIKSYEEILVNYDRVNKHIPFIADSSIIKNSTHC